MVKLTLEMIFKQIPGLNKRRSDLSIEQCLGRLTHLPVQHRMIDGIVNARILCHFSFIHSHRLGFDSTVSSVNGDLSLWKSFNTNRKFEFRREFNASLLTEQSFAETGKSRSMSKITKIVLSRKSNSSSRRFRTLSRVGGDFHWKSTISRGRKTSLRSSNDSSFVHSSRWRREKKNLDQMDFWSFLEVLNVSGNHLDTLIELGDLQNLRELSASNNRLENFTELVQLVSEWRYLKRLETSRNPFCVAKRYRERLIVVGSCLGKRRSSSIVRSMKNVIE